MQLLKGFKAVGYCRVSTNDKGQTNETQKRLIEQWAEKHEVEVVAYFCDEMTGTTLDRPGLKQAIGTIIMDDIPLLIVQDQSRLTRNEDLPEIKKKIPNCQIRYTEQEIDPESLPGRLMDAIKQVMDKEENIIRSNKTKIGMETRKLAGKHVGRPAAFMFKDEMDTAPKGKYQLPNPDEKKLGTLAVTEEYILQFADQGFSVNKLAKKILGISRPTLVRAMKRAGIFDEYYYRLEKSSAKGEI